MTRTGRWDRQSFRVLTFQGRSERDRDFFDLIFCPRNRPDFALPLTDALPLIRCLEDVEDLCPRMTLVFPGRTTLVLCDDDFANTQRL